MDRKNVIFNILGIGSFTGIMAYAGLIFFGSVPNAVLIHVPIHSTLETAGGVAALLIAMVLFQQRREFQQGTFFWVGAGIGCMGVLDTFHAMSIPGEAFVFLHSAASLAGGLFFILIYIPENRFINIVSEKRWIAGIAYVMSISVGIRALVFPNDVPTVAILYDGSFTQAASYFNSLAGVLFLASVPGFYLRCKHYGNKDFMVFMALGLLFGLAELIFPYSDTWNTLWWSWHVMRFLAYIMTLVYLVINHVHVSSKGGTR